MNVVAFRAAGESGKLWYLFHASRTVFLVQVGTTDTWLNGEGVWWVSLLVTVFNFCRSTVLLGDPSFFGATTIFEHQTVGVPVGTCSMMPNATSQSRSCFTLFFQWCGTGIGVCTTDGFALWVNVISSGLPVIICNGWCGQVLNALDLKCSRSHNSWWSLLLAIGGNGMLAGLSGTVVLRGHPHNAFPLMMADASILDVWLGKLWGINYKSFSADSD